MDHYIIKIYRRKPLTWQKIVGTVENVANGQSHNFHNVDELMLLLGAIPSTEPPDKPPKPG